MRRVKLSEIFEIARGGSPRPIKKFVTKDPDGINWIKIGDTNESKYLTKTKEKIIPEGKSKSRYVEPGDFLLTNSMSFGRPYISKIYGCIHDGWLVLKPKTEEIFEDYIYYVLGSPLMKREFEKQAKGTTVKNLNITLVSDVKIPLPSLSEQKAIVAKLDRAQRLIDIDRQMLAKYDELIQSVFLEMFGDPVRNPKGLKEKEFGELVEITGGYAFKSKDFIDDESGVKVVKIANVHFIDLDWSEVQYLPIESLEEHEKYSLKEGDILLALTRPIINSLGAVKAVVVKDSDLPALLNQRVARIRVDSDEVTEDYITSFIYTQHFKRQIEKYASTSLQPNVSNNEVSKIKVLVPEIDQQRKFSEIRQRILNERDALEVNQKKSEELFSSLVQGVFG